MSKIDSSVFGNALVKAGIFTKEELNDIHRVVIDVKSGHAVMVYVEKYGDVEALAGLAPLIKDMISHE